MLLASCQPAAVQPSSTPTTAATVAIPTSALPATATILLAASPTPEPTLTAPPPLAVSSARGESYTVGLSPDGDLLSFHSSAADLAANDSNGVMDAFVYLRKEDEVRRVSVSSEGQESRALSWVVGPPLVERYAYFKSESNALASPDPVLRTTLYEHDLRTGRTRSMGLEEMDFSQWSDSGQAEAVQFILSRDRRRVLIEAITGDGQFTRVFLHDTATGETRLISRGLDGAPANGPSYAAALSFDGLYSFFYSWAGNLVVGDNAVCQAGPVVENCGDLFVYDRSNGQVSRIPVGATSGLGGPALSASISRNGRFAAFHTYNPASLAYEVTVYDRITGRRETICAEDSTACSGHSPVISANGRYVLFTNGQVYLHDRDHQTNTLISQTPDGSPANGISGYTSQPEGVFGALALSADARWAAYSSSSDNLLPGLPYKPRCLEDPAYSFEQPESGCFDVFLYNVLTGETTWVTRPRITE